MTNAARKMNLDGGSLADGKLIVQRLLSKKRSLRSVNVVLVFNSHV